MWFFDTDFFHFEWYSQDPFYDAACIISPILFIAEIILFYEYSTICLPMHQLKVYIRGCTSSKALTVQKSLTLYSQDVPVNNLHCMII